MEGEELVKENRASVPPLSWLWLLAGLAAGGAALGVALSVDYALPEPLTRDTARPDQFIGQLAHEHLVNLTAIGPRVAGSYENEVVTVGVLVAAIKRIAAAASPHNHVELDVQRASGSFPLTFMDGMTNVYREVQSVVARVRGAGDAARSPRALLLNCHFDSVPDSPGASDDGAGCAVLLETLRALSAAPRPLRHHAIFLFNGAEENILQASHAFITQHKWARSVRAFVNVEACGSGGREVLFQAGPRAPWLLEAYARAAPHPFASSLAQEMFESGLVPADTDFRVFRDFGNVSGVDLAWSANGYVYHTRLDTAARVPPASLQRTGDNVLGLARALLAGEQLGRAPEHDEHERAPAYCDVLGVLLLSARAPAALTLAGATVALVALKIHLNARLAQAQLYIARGAWWRHVGGAALGVCACAAAGVGAAGAVGGALHAAGVRLAWYAQPWLLLPLFVGPALAACWAGLRALGGRGAWWGARGWWGARLLHDACAALCAAAVALCALRGLRSGFLPLLWALGAALGDLLGCWLAGSLLPALQTTYLALNTAHMLVPLMGRAGAGGLVPPDVVMGAAAGALGGGSLAWLLPYVRAARGLRRLEVWLWAACLCAVLAAWAGALGPAYSDERPQRLMLFHTRRTVHADTPDTPPRVEHFYWAPELDANTGTTLHEYLEGVERVSAEECSARVYCGAPYYLPVLGLVPGSFRARVAAAPRVALQARVRAAGRVVHVRVGRAPQHVVLVVAPAHGVALLACAVGGQPVALQRGAVGRGGPTYFIALHSGRPGASWHVTLQLGGGQVGAPLVALSLAGHALFGADKLQAEHARLAALLPLHVAHTGWGVDLHLYSLRLQAAAST